MCGITFCVTSALCCAGTACCKCLCMPAKAAGIAAKNFAKLGYVFLQLGMILIAVAFMYLFDWIFGNDFAETLGFTCPGSGTAENASCTGSSALIRMTFALACFHLVIFCITLLRNKCASVLHDGFWSGKFLLIFAIWVLSLWIPNDPFMNGYMNFSKWVSVVFLFYQAILILSMAYALNDTLMTNVEKEGGNALSCSGIIMLVVWAVFLVGDIIWIVFSYMRFAGHGCTGNSTIITITTVIGVAIHGLVLLRSRPDASVLTSSVVLAYFLNLQWAAMASAPNPECNPYYGEGAGMKTMEIIFGFFFTFGSLLVISGQTSKEDDKTLTNDLTSGMKEKEEETKKGAEDVELMAGSANHTNSDAELAGTEKKPVTGEEHMFPISNATIMFQGLMILSAIYFAMLLTNWGNPSVQDTDTSFFKVSYNAYWIQICAMWFAQAIYIFSLTAPFCLNREFGETN